MAADMDVDKAVWAVFERHVVDLGMSMTALGQTETHLADIFGPGWFTVRTRRFDLRLSTAWDLRTGYDFNMEADRLRAHASVWRKRSDPCSLDLYVPQHFRRCRTCREHLTFVSDLHNGQILDMYRHSFHGSLLGHTNF